MKTLNILASYRSPGRGPVGLTWDGRFLWNADYTAGSIFQIEPESNSPIKQLICPGNLSGITWTGTALWQSLHDGGALRRINPETNDFDQTILVYEHGWLSGLAWDGTHLWAASQQNGKLFALDQDSGEVVYTIPAPVACGGLGYYNGSLWLGVPNKMTFNKEYEQFEWESEEQTFAVVQLDPKDGTEIDSFAVDFLPMGIAWVNDQLWLTHTRAKKLYKAVLS